MSESTPEPDESKVAGQTTETWLRRASCFARRTCTRLIWSLIVVGLALRFTVRDQFHPLSLVYYVTPIASLPIWLLLANFMRIRNRDFEKSKSNRLRRRLVAIACLGCVAWGYCSENVERAEAAKSGDVRLVFWNTSHTAMGVNRLATHLKAWDASVIGLVEAETYYPQILEEWQSQLPEYKVIKAHFGGLIAVKGTVERQFSHHLSPTSWCEQFDLTVGGDQFTVLLVDISAQLSLSRRQPVQELADLAKTLDDRPVVIMGDFNIPDDSILLRPLSENCRNAFREHGTGYAPTWPMPLPVLALDQVWVNQRVKVSQCEHIWSINSDHRPVITSVSFSNQ
jgi:vancomycin resistance protein VanJ